MNWLVFPTLTDPDQKNETQKGFLCRATLLKAIIVDCTIIELGWLKIDSLKFWQIVLSVLYHQKYNKT